MTAPVRRQCAGTLDPCAPHPWPCSALVTARLLAGTSSTAVRRRDVVELGHGLVAEYVLGRRRRPTRPSGPWLRARLARATPPSGGLTGPTAPEIEEAA